MQNLIRSIRDWWHGAAGDALRTPAPREVIVHDPGAERPHDLDDPFLDPGGAVARSAGVIADNAAKESLTRIAPAAAASAPACPPGERMV